MNEHNNNIYIYFTHKMDLNMQNRLVLIIQKNFVAYIETLF